MQAVGAGASQAARWWETAAHECPRPPALKKHHRKGDPEGQVWLPALPAGTEGASGAATEAAWLLLHLTRSTDFEWSSSAILKGTVRKTTLALRLLKRVKKWSNPRSSTYPSCKQHGHGLMYAADLCHLLPNSCGWYQALLKYNFWVK